MTQNSLAQLEKLKNAEIIPPMILDENTAISFLNSIFNVNLESLEAFPQNHFYNVSIYDIPEGKSQFSIETVKKIINDISLKPYEGKSFFVLKNFDTASNSAQNSALKLIEECPPYAVIMLVVSSAKNLLPTILSRAIVLVDETTHNFISDEISALLDEFFRGNKIPWLTHLYANEFTETEAISILTKVFGFLDFTQKEKCRFLLEALQTTNEKPKNILEAFFLGEDF